jgi:hypothetical protein
LTTVAFGRAPSPLASGAWAGSKHAVSSTSQEHMGTSLMISVSASERKIEDGEG